MLWSFSTLGCPDKSWDEALALVTRYGLDGLEVRALSGSLDVPKALRARFGSPEKIAGEVLPVRCFGLNTSFRLIGGDEDARRELLDFVPWAEALGVPYLRVFDGGKFTGELDAASQASAEGNLAWWREQRSAWGWNVDLMVETHDALCRAPVISALQETLAEPVALLWDSHHTWRKGGEDPLSTWAVVRPWTVHIHFKDSISRPSAKLPYTYVVPGEGEMALQALFDRLRADAYAGALSLEWEKKWHPDLPELEVALEALRPWVSAAE